MSSGVGWSLAIAGWVIGLAVALVPGVPGAVVALLGVVALSALTGGTTVSPMALLLATLFAGASAVAQALAPVWGVRSVSTATGAATGAVVLGALGLLVPLPFAALLSGGLGAVVGGLVGRGSLLARASLPLALLPAMLLAVLADLVAVFAIAAVVGLGAFLSA